MILNLQDAPESPIERLMWLSGVMEEVKEELDAEFRRAYYEARLQKQLEPALALGLHSRKRILAYTRAENEKRGRTVRWQDGVDPTSTAYTGA
jgi:hypothetical protein